MPYKNIEDKRRNDREYYKNRDTSNPEYRERIKEANKKCYARRCEKTPWLLHWKAARQRCNNPNNKNYGGKDIRMLLTKDEMKMLWIRDHADQMKRPSIDRINHKGDYIFGNCRFLELSENIKKSNQMRSNT